MLCTRLEGTTVSDIYDQLAPDQLDCLLDQLTSIMFQLKAASSTFSHIGGLRFTDDKHLDLVPGPVLQETLWHISDIDIYWPKGESF